MTAVDTGKIENNIESLLRNPPDFRDIPESNIELAVLRAWKNLYTSMPGEYDVTIKQIYQAIPEGHYTETILKNALDYGIKNIWNEKSEKALNREVASNLIKYESNLINQLPKFIVDDDLRKQAIKQTANAIVDMPDSEISKDMYELALVSPDNFFISVAAKILSQPHDSKFLIKALKNFEQVCDREDKKENPLYRFIPPQHYTQEIADYISKQYPDAINYIPLQFLEEGHYMEMLSITPYIFPHLPPQALTWDVCMSMLEKDPHAIYFFPKEFLTPENLETIIKLSPSSIHGIDKDLHTKELIELAKHSYDPKEGLNKLVEKEHFIPFIRQLPDEAFTTELINTAVSKNPDVLRNLKEKHRNPEACLIAALQKDLYKKHFIPDPVKKGLNVYRYYFSKLDEFNKRGLKSFAEIKNAYEWGVSFVPLKEKNTEKQLKTTSKQPKRRL